MDTGLAKRLLDQVRRTVHDLALWARGVHILRQASPRMCHNAPRHHPAAQQHRPARTLGWPENPDTQLTKPVNLTTRTTLSRSPSSAASGDRVTRRLHGRDTMGGAPHSRRYAPFRDASRLMVHCCAAAAPSSTEVSWPTRPRMTLPSLKGRCPAAGCATRPTCGATSARHTAHGLRRYNTTAPNPRHVPVNTRLPVRTVET